MEILVMQLVFNAKTCMTTMHQATEIYLGKIAMQTLEALVEFYLGSHSLLRAT